MAGYSPKSLINKLGYKPGDVVKVFNPPKWFGEYLQNEGIVMDGEPTWLHGFFTEPAKITQFIEFFESRGPSKGFWVSWPKKSSGVKTDVTEQTFRDMILPTGWVDVKVTAIDDTWSGLLFYKRKN